MEHSALHSRSSYIPPHRTQLHPRMFSPKPPSPSRNKYFLAAAAFLVFPFLFYLFSTARSVHLSSRFAADPHPAASFAVLIHAASSASTVRVFQSLGEGPIPFVARDGSGPNSQAFRPGLAAFAGRPDGAGESLLSLLDFARRRVPKKLRRATTVRLLATGDLATWDLLLRERILESCRLVLRSSGFLFRDEWASSITGQERGVYSWVATNYALGTLGGDPYDTKGVMELGGASAQVTLVSEEPPTMEFSQIIKVAGVSYNLYSASMIQLGQEAMWKSFTEYHMSKVSLSGASSVEGVGSSPCIPRGYTHLSTLASIFNASQNKILPIHYSGNFTACKIEISTFIQKQGLCVAPPCKELPFTPHLHAGSISVENLYYASELFGIVPRASLAELVAAGKRYCEDDWINLSTEHKGVEESELLRFCFSSAYIVAVLQDGLGISMNDKRIGFAIHEEGAPVDWTLGAFILHMEMGPQLESGADIIGNETVMCLSLFAVLFLVLVAAFYTTWWRKPQMKTVYDLEKGHYIVTRIPRQASGVQG